MVTLTAPGTEVLPWDESVCSWRGPHKHAGPSGCRIELAALNRWQADLNERFHRLTVAARKRAAVHEPVVAARAWECQDRGAPHVHLVVVANAAGERFVEALTAMAEGYGFGAVSDQGYTAKGAYAHAHYLSKYLSKRDERVESERRAMLFEGSLLPRQTVWVSPVLTRRSGATMQVAGLMRSLWAYAEGYREKPPVMPDGVVEAHVLYWRRVQRRGRDAVPRSVVVRDYGDYASWDAVAWPGAAVDALVYARTEDAATVA